MKALEKEKEELTIERDEQMDEISAVSYKTHIIIM